MNRLTKIIKEVLSSPPKKDCGCGCHGKCATNAPMLNENLGVKVIITENMKYHIDNKKPLTENTFRYGSKAFLDLWTEARYLYSRDAIDLSESDKQIILETHLGERGLFNGELVPLDLPMEDLDENTDEVVAVLNNPNIEDDVKSMLFNAYKNGQLTSTQVINIVKKTVKEHLNEVENNSGELEQIKREIEALIPKVSWIDDVRYSYKGDLDIELDYELDPQEIKQLSQLASKYNMNLLYKIGKNATLTKRRIPPKLNEAEFKGKEVQLGKPKRGGSKKFFVYVKDPKTKKVKKVSFGDTTGLSTKINNPKARKAFAARQQCDKKKDRTKAGYWACNIGKYWKSLGGSNNFSGYW